MELYNKFKDDGFILRKDKIAQRVRSENSTFREIESRIDKNISLEEWQKLRKELPLGKWIDLILRSIGYNPTGLLFYEKLVILMRLIPFCQKSFHMVELGPPGTGKSFIYNGLSDKSIIKTDSITVPQLFGVLNSKKEDSPKGVINDYDVVVLDEIAEKTTIDGDAATALRDFLSTKKSGRDGEYKTSDASLVLLANLKHGQEEISNYNNRSNVDLFEHFPESMNNEPFKDRIALAVPGWKVRQNNADCHPVDSGDAINIHSLFDLFEELREFPIDIPLVKIKGQGDRGKKGIENTIRGLLKLLFLGKFGANEHLAVQDIAIFGRRLVTSSQAKLNLSGPASLLAVEVALTAFNDKTIKGIDKAYIDDDRIYLKFKDENELYKIPLTENGLMISSKELSLYKKLRNEDPGLLKNLVHLEEFRQGAIKNIVVQDYVQPLSDKKLLSFDESPSLELLENLPSKGYRDLFIQQAEEIISLRGKVDFLENEIESLKTILETHLNNMKKDMLELKAWEDLGTNRTYVEEKSGFISLTKKSQKPAKNTIDQIKKALKLKRNPSPEDYCIDDKGIVKLVNFGHLI